MNREVTKSFNHISDCWAAVRECRTVDELDEQFEWFPRWSGDWSWDVTEDGRVVVYNEYDDKNLGWQYDCEDTDIYLEDDDQDMVSEGLFNVGL